MRTLEETCTASTWTASAAPVLDAISWQQLMRNEIPLAVIPGFATAEECARLSRSAAEIGFEPYENVEPPIDRIGITVFEYDHIGAPQYFRDARGALAVQQQIFSRAFDPIERLIARLGQVAGGPVGVAVDPALGRYHAGLVRRIERGTLLHVDFAPAEQPTWQVAQVLTQISWNLYVEVRPAGTGVTHVFNRQWTPADDRLKIPHTYGYDHAVVEGAERFAYVPVEGDVCLFNTRNFHEVEPSAGRRVTCGSAIGVFDDGSTVLWS